MATFWLVSDNVHFSSDKKENVLNVFLQVKNVEVYCTVLAVLLPSEGHRRTCQVSFGLDRAASSGRGQIFYFLQAFVLYQLLVSLQT